MAFYFVKLLSLDAMMTSLVVLICLSISSCLNLNTFQTLQNERQEGPLPAMASCQRGLADVKTWGSRFRSLRFFGSNSWRPLWGLLWGAKRRVNCSAKPNKEEVGAPNFRRLWSSSQGDQSTHVRSICLYEVATISRKVFGIPRKRRQMTFYIVYTSANPHSPGLGYIWKVDERVSADLHYR